jgi:hypothetical protein
MLGPSQLCVRNVGDLCRRLKFVGAQWHTAQSLGKNLHTGLSATVRIFLMQSLWKSCMENREFLESRAYAAFQSQVPAKSGGRTKEVRKAVLSLDPDRFATDAAAFCNAEYRRASSQAKITPFPQY